MITPVKSTQITEFVETFYGWIMLYRLGNPSYVNIMNSISKRSTAEEGKKLSPELCIAFSDSWLAPTKSTPPGLQLIIVSDV